MGRKSAVKRRFQAPFFSEVAEKCGTVSLVFGNGFDICDFVPHAAEHILSETDKF